MLSAFNHLPARIVELGSAVAANAEPLRSHLSRQMPRWDSKGGNDAWGGSSASSQSGEQACENQNLDRTQCAAVGCCEYDDGRCWSSVGSAACDGTGSAGQGNMHGSAGQGNMHGSGGGGGGAGGADQMALMMPCFMSLADPSVLMSGAASGDYVALMPVLCSTDTCRDFLLNSIDTSTAPPGVSPQAMLSCVCEEPAMMEFVSDAMDDGQINNPDADENMASLCSSPTCRPLMLSSIEGSADFPPDILSADALDCGCLSSNTVQMIMCSMGPDDDDAVPHGPGAGGGFGPGPGDGSSPPLAQRPPGCSDMPVDGSFSPAALADFCGEPKCVPIVSAVGAEFGQSCDTAMPPPSPSLSPPPPSPSPVPISSSPHPSGQSAQGVPSKEPEDPPQHSQTHAPPDTLENDQSPHEGGGTSAGVVVLALFIVVAIGAAGGFYLHKTGRLRGQFALPVNLPKPRASISSTAGAPPPNQQQVALPALAPPAGGGMWELNDAARAAAQQEAAGSAGYQPPQPGAPV